MPRGPLPTGTAIRRNKPTIPTTHLPVTGRSGPVPVPPSTYELGPSGVDWWAWAWTTPQAAAWSDGDLFAVGRRASLEDDLAALDAVEAGFDLAELLHIEDDAPALRRLELLIERLRALAGNRLAVVRAMTDLDDRLGLTPKGLAALRWKIVDAETDAKSGAPRPAAKKRRQLKVVPDAAVG